VLSYKVLQLMGRANYNEIVPYITDDRRPGTINGGELRCVLSHLTAIRRAYLEGDEIAMIVEDDIDSLTHVSTRRMADLYFYFLPLHAY
jgi:GR25 family glycosyltransferase involved in LPS biosynthesis